MRRSSTAAFATTAFVSNALDPPPDEGIKHAAWAFAQVFRGQGAVVHPVGPASPFLERKLLMSRRVTSQFRRLGVQRVVYVPTQSGTLGTLLRARVLAAMARVDVAVFALQPRALPAGGGVLARFLAPSMLLTPSPTVLAEAQGRGWKAQLVPLGVDSERFRPVPPDRRRLLRQKYGLKADVPVVLHIGHARPNRGLEWLEALPRDLQRVVVVGTSLGADRAIVERLRAGGILVFDTFVDAVHEIYQLSDVYAFPVRDEQGAVAAPLSVLEAMACNLPVVTTPFGVLPQIFVQGKGVTFVDDCASFRTAVGRATRTGGDGVETRAQVAPFGWHELSRSIVGSMEDS